MKLTKKKIMITFGAIAGAIAVVGIVFGILGYWPIAFVGYSPITYNAFKEQTLIADRFYAVSLQVSGQNMDLMKSGAVIKDLQRTALDALVEQLLIERELDRRFKSDDLDRLVANKTGGIDLNSDEIKKGTSLLYGLTVDEFKREILVPKAKQELLEGNMLLNDGGTFNDWLTRQKRSASVAVFVPGLRWDGSEVVVK